MRQVVTIFEDLYNKDPLYITVETALQRIQSGKQKQKIDLVRGGNKDARSNCLLYCGVVGSRSVRMSRCKSIAASSSWTSTTLET